ncbi:hypothetical protein [Candidatus Marithrix sp. Canyon 246]|uniref:hypothetical protein n=1 Tax=Candidatus Marithrix sp. Canyon 246 TaxID=1827136 RepID=UPI00209B406C|nr:hypothetical protein [Candidatus Marithrix sp. Canyon 246]
MAHSNSGCGVLVLVFVIMPSLTLKTKTAPLPALNAVVLMVIFIVPTPSHPTDKPSSAAEVTEL